MTPSPAERDKLFKGFARALFKGDVEGLYQVVTSDFLWSFHDGLGLTKSLAGPDAIRAHLAEQKALFSAQRFHDVAYHHARQLHDLSRQRDLARQRGATGTARHRELYVQRRKARDQGRLSQARVFALGLCSAYVRF